MRIFVLGASGHTGTHILDLALARSHEVTAFTRSPKKIARQHPGLSVVRGDPHNVDELAKAMRGHDAVLSAIGVQPPTAFRHHTVIQDCAAATTRALERSGVQRLVLVSAAVLFPIEGVLYALFRLLLKHVARDLNAAEVIVRQSPLEWTIARPPRLTNGPGESYRASRDSLPQKAFSLPFRAVAAFMLDSVEQHSHIREIVGLG